MTDRRSSLAAVKARPTAAIRSVPVATMRMPAMEREELNQDIGFMMWSRDRWRAKQFE